MIPTLLTAKLTATGRYMLPLKLAPSRCYLDPIYIVHGSSLPHESTPNGISIGSAVLHSSRLCSTHTSRHL